MIFTTEETTMPSKIKKQRPGPKPGGPQKPQNEREVLITASAIRCRETLDRIWKPGKHAMANNGIVGNLSATPVGRHRSKRDHRTERRDLIETAAKGYRVGSLFVLTDC